MIRKSLHSGLLLILFNFLYSHNAKAQDEYGPCDFILIMAYDRDTGTGEGYDHTNSTKTFTITTPRTIRVSYRHFFSGAQGISNIQFSDAEGNTVYVADGGSQPEQGLQIFDLPAGTYFMFTQASCFSSTGFVESRLDVSSFKVTPNKYDLQGGGIACDGLFLPITLSNSDPGFSYQLSRDNVPITTVYSSSGGPITFGGFQTPGTYQVTTVAPCVEETMNNTVVISNPITSNITGGPQVCNGGVIPVPIGLDNSNAGATYQLYRDNVPISTAYSAGGGPVSFGSFQAPGTYVARMISPCSIPMSGSVVLIQPHIYNVIGGGYACNGGTGYVPIALENSDAGITYQLYRDNFPVTTAYSASGGPVLFGNFQIPGVYTVSTASPCPNIPMGGSATISDPRPGSFSVKNDGPKCSPTPPINLIVETPIPGATYTWSGPYGFTLTTTNSTTPILGLEGSFPYSVYAVVNGCATPAVSTTVIVKPTPIQYAVEGANTVCEGTPVAVTLNGSESGVSYQLFRNGVQSGSAVTGTGGSLNWPVQSSGTYAVVGTRDNCTQTMNSNATITINPLPASYTVTGGGSRCSNAESLSVSLSGSQTGVSYQLKINGANIGTPVTGTGSVLQWTGLTAAGTYTIQATHGTGGCPRDMSGNVPIVVNPSPVQYAVSGSTTVCEGTSVAVTLSGSEAEVTYQLYKDGVASGSAVTGTGSSLTWLVQVSGAYTVIGTRNTCTQSMSGSAVVIINPLPVLYTITGGGSRCSNAESLTVGLNGSQTGVNYQLKLNGTNTGVAVAGTGSVLQWTGLTAAGTYTIQAVHGTGGCARDMNGSASVVVNPSPVQYAVSGSTTVCEGTSVVVTLSGSESVVNYQLYKDGVASGSAVTGTGSSLSWSVQTSGTYTVVGTRGTCTQSMSGNAAIIINPVPSAFPLGGGGTECYGGAGFTISQAGSQTGVSYQLKVDGVNTGLPVAGTGSGLSWLNQTTGGVYTVVATHGTGGCMQTMTNSRTIIINPLPTVYTIGGGATFCTPTQFAITLSDSDVGINYLLKRGSITISTLAGTGNALSWPNQITPGDYTITATNTTTNCTQSMGTATVILNTQPTSYTLNGGGSRCENGPALNINMVGSQSTAMYQLKRDGVNVGNAVQGTGSAMSWTSLTEAGTYTVEATLNGCTRVMSSPRTITIKPAPTTADAGPDLNVCGLEVNLAGNTPIVGTGTWTQISGPEQSNIDNINNPGTFVSVGQPDTYLYSWTINNNGCVSTDVVQITYNTVATVADAGPDQEVCDGSLFAAMSANMPEIGNGEWTLVSGPEGGVLYPDAYAPDAILFAPEQGVYVYRWTITNEPCTPSIDEVQISFGITALSFTVLQEQNSGERRFFIEEAETDLNWRNQYTYQWLYINSNGVQTEVTHPAMPWSTNLFIFPDFLSGNVTNASLIVEVSSSEGCFTRKVYGAEASQGGARIKQLTPVIQETSSEEDVQVYPVPASRLLNVEVPFDGSWKLALMNLNGVSVTSKVSYERSTVLDVSETPAGLYFLYIQGSHGQVIRKVEVVK